MKCYKYNKKLFFMRETTGWGSIKSFLDKQESYPEFIALGAYNHAYAFFLYRRHHFKDGSIAEIWPWVVFSDLEECLKEFPNLFEIVNPHNYIMITNPEIKFALDLAGVA